jgi:glycolate oxidase iron-sulfur subunit
MHHDIPDDACGPQTRFMTDAIESCVHCGFCLPTCPTYVTMGQEMDSPRGRIVLMKEVLEGTIELEAAVPHIDNCLGCQACQTACPSGVEYGQLLSPFRAYAETRRTRPPSSRLQRMLIGRTLPHPRRFRLAMRAGALARPLARVLPSGPAAALRLVPPAAPRAAKLPGVIAAEGEVRARVALLVGCAQQVLAPGIAWAAVRVLARNGVEVTIPSGQGCCGALALHTGAADDARRFARRNLEAFAGADAVITTAAGCGSGMREYGQLFAGTPEEDAAAALATRTVDVAQFLADLGLRNAPPPVQPTVVAYQDACHLSHAQGVARQPRDLLAAVHGITLVEPLEPELCCGSAGTYNIERPEIARRLGERKARELIATGASVIASGNIGCITQLQSHLRAQGREIPVLHTVEILDRAYDRAPLA